MRRLVLTLLASAAITVATTNLAAADDAFCVVKNVTAMQDRVHVFCALVKKGPTRYFAVEADKPLAAHLVALAGGNADELMVAKKKVGLRVYYDEDPANNPSGCLESDCRRLTGVMLEALE